MTALLVMLLLVSPALFLAWHAWVAGNAENDDGSGW